MTASFTIPATVTVTALVTETRTYSVKTCKWTDLLQNILKEQSGEAHSCLNNKSIVDSRKRRIVTSIVVELKKQTPSIVVQLAHGVMHAMSHSLSNS